MVAGSEVAALAEAADSAAEVDSVAGEGAAVAPGEDFSLSLIKEKNA